MTNKYDFETIVDRSKFNSIGKHYEKFTGGVKIKEGFSPVNVWIGGDLWFPTAPSLTKAVVERARHPFYNMIQTPCDEYYESIINWHETRYGVRDIKKEYISPHNNLPGVVIAALKALCMPGDGVLLTLPVFNAYFNDLEFAGCKPVLSGLKKDVDEVWRIDLTDMEDKIIKNHVHVAIFSSPHNPTGRVWERWELEAMMELFEKHHVIAIMDETWCDFTLNGHIHTPVQSVSEYARQHTIVNYGLSKPFGSNGLNAAYTIIYNPYLRERVNAATVRTQLDFPSPFAEAAVIGALNPEGAEWLDDARELINKNMNYAYEYVTNRLDGVTTSLPDGTYLLVIDCEEWCKKNDVPMEELVHKGYQYGVIWAAGARNYGEYGIRMCLAHPFSQIEEVFERLEKYVFNVR